MTIQQFHHILSQQYYNSKRQFGYHVGQCTTGFRGSNPYGSKIIFFQGINLFSLLQHYCDIVYTYLKTGPSLDED